MNHAPNKSIRENEYFTQQYTDTTYENFQIVVRPP